MVGELRQCCGGQRTWGSLLSSRHMTQPPDGPVPPQEQSQPYQQAQPYVQPPPYGQYPAASYPAASYPGPPLRTGTNGFAIASLVFGIIGGFLLSVIFGIVALTQIRRSAQDGKGLAIAGLVLSGAWVAALGLLIALVVATGADRDATGEIATGGSVEVDSLRVGDCVNGIKLDREFRRLPAVPCAEPHEAEVFAVFSISGSAAWPGDTVVEEQAESCVDKLVSYAPQVAMDEKLDVVYLQPTRQSWARGDRAITCIAVDLNKRTGSLRG